MKINYAFCNGEHDTVDVDEELGRFIMDSRRAEHANNERQRYHCYPLFDENDKEIELADWRQPGDAIEKEELRDELRDMLNLLTDVQRRRLLMLAAGMSSREIAEREGTSHTAVLLSIQQARKKIINKMK